MDRDSADTSRHCLGFGQKPVSYEAMSVTRNGHVQGSGNEDIRAKVKFFENPAKHIALAGIRS